MALLLIAIACGAVAAGGAALYVRRSATDRGAALRAVAARLGWNFSDEAPFGTIWILERFELFRPGQHRHLTHFMTSPAGDPQGAAFEYAYTIASGESVETQRQTVFYAAGAGLDLPSFTLSPENLLHRIAEALGYQDIDLPQRPQFSRMFLLRGEHEVHVREAFSDTVAEFFEQRPGMCAVGGGAELLLWRPGRLVKPDDVATLIQDGFDLVKRFATPRP